LTLLMAPWLIVRAIWQILVFFFSAMFSAEWQENPERRIRFLCGIPFLLLLGASLLGIAMSVASQASVQHRYARAMDSAETQGDIALASKFGERVMEVARKQDPEALYGITKFFERNALQERADAIVEGLAPIDTKGFPLAHRQRAIEAFRVLERAIDPELLDQLFWHLRHADGDDDEQILMIWVEYYLYVGDLRRAVHKLELLATKDPQHWFAVADLAGSLGDVDRTIHALTAAAEAYSGQLAQNPMSKEIRMHYASAMTQLGKLEPSLESMQFGWQLTNDQDFAKGLSQLMVLQFDRTVRREPENFLAMWNHLLEALRWDAENTDIYDRLVLLHQATSDVARKNQVIAKLKQTTVERPNFYKSFFSLSALELQAGQLENASVLLHRTIELAPESHAALNNLAWLLMLRSEQEGRPELLIQAEEFANRAVNVLPNSGSYRDTLGSILLKQHRVEEAVTELERALTNVIDPLPVHQKLAAAYRMLGQSEIADRHERVATEQRLNASSPKR
jgi:tetratricopeptide (TPR) repeat protein